MSRGIFIALEGGEGGGKTTVSRLLAEHLRLDKDLEVVLTREPGATDIGAKIRALLLDPASEMEPLTEMMLFAADRAQHVSTVVQPALDRGAVVITDRFEDSTIAYQGAGKENDLNMVKLLCKIAAQGERPDITFILDLPAKRGLKRAGAVGVPDRMELLGEAFHLRVRKAFLELAKVEPRRYEVIDATAEVESVLEAIITRLARVMEERGVPLSEVG